MRRKLLVIPLLLFATSLRAEVIPFSAEVGYRWASIDGNEGLYRSQVNERSGFMLRAFTMFTPEFRISSSDLGNGPSSALRFELSTNPSYRFRLGYRTMDAFNALPNFANPLLDQGVVVGQHTFDRTRQMVDADLEFLPQGAISPYIGYSYNRNHGPGTTTYFVGQDEFHLLQDLNERNNELRGGASFHYQKFYGQATLGWRKFEGTENLTLAQAPTNGNNNTPILGNPITADQITSGNSSSVKTPFANLYVAHQTTSRLKLIANYTRMNATSDGTGSESDTGAFVSFPLARNFGGLNEAATTSAKNLTWRGGVRAEFIIRPNIDLQAIWQRDHRNLDGDALINTLYLQTTTFAGLDKKDMQTVLNSTNALGRQEDAYGVTLNLRALGPFAVRSEIRQAQQDITLSPDISEIVVPGASQGGTFKRKVNTFDNSATFSKSGWSAQASWRADRADSPVFRTDFIDRDRYRARGAWTSKKQVLTIGLTGEQTDQSNDASDINFTSKIRSYTGDVEIAPNSILRLHGAASRYKANTNILARQPQNFDTFDSFHVENGKSVEGGFGLLFKKGTLDANLINFKNEGSLAYNMKRYRARATWDVKAHAGLAFEYSKDKYDELLTPDGTYNADRYGVFIRWTP